MCQHYQAEARIVMGMEAYQRRLAHAMRGRMARQEGRPRSDWEDLTYGVSHDGPDDPGRYRSPSWWHAHPWDGPLIQGWLGGWDDEDLRISAGGEPMTEEERATDEADLDFLGNLAQHLRYAGHRHDMRGPELSRLARLRGADDHADYEHGVHGVLTEVAVTWTRAAKDLIEARLVPHRVAMRAHRSLESVG